MSTAITGLFFNYYAKVTLIRELLKKSFFQFFPTEINERKKTVDIQVSIVLFFKSLQRKQRKKLQLKCHNRSQS